MLVAILRRVASARILNEERERPAVPTLLDRRNEEFTLMRAFRYRLYPTRQQEEELLLQLELCRRLYNKALWWRQGAWERRGQRVGLKEQTLALTQLKKEMPDYRGLSPGTLEDVVKRVHRAYEGFFRRTKAGEAPGYPRSKGLGRYRSLSVPRRREFHFDWDGRKRHGRLSVRGIRGLRVRMHRSFPEGATVRRVTIKREGSGHWYVVFGWDIEGYRPPEHKARDEAVGLHPGLVPYLSTDAGEIYEAPSEPAHECAKLRRLQREFARTERGSNRSKKRLAILARYYERERARRRQFRHELSKDLVERYGHLFVNRLAVSEMLSGQNSLKPLRGRVAEAAWYDLSEMIRYKAESAGAVYAEVDAEGVVQECSQCDADVPKTLAERVHHCPRCGLRTSRGVNAARNAKKRAVRVLWGGERNEPPPSKRERSRATQLGVVGEAKLGSRAVSTRPHKGARGRQQID